MGYMDKLILSEKQRENLKGLVEKIKSVMPLSLYSHSMGTLKYAQKLANLHFKPKTKRDELKDKRSEDSRREIYYRLCVSCILHDYGKIYGYMELVKTAKKNKLNINKFELNSQSLIHGFVGDYLVKRDFGISDEKILKAIKFHTIGYCDMSLEDKILFISDKVEEGRRYEGIDNFRNLSINNINLCLLEIYRSTIIYVIKRNKLLHPDTSKIWNSICGGK
jgi:predicted HD superfamily hydrolase involved in NAD metabolism